MPGTRYSKASVLEFLNAKLDGIDDKIVEKRADYDTAYIGLANEMAEFLQVYQDRIAAVDMASAAFYEARQHDDLVTLREATSELQRLIHAVETDMPRIRLDRGLWGYYPDAEVKRLDRTAEAERAEIERRIQLVTDAEGESFSITDLEKLGLLKYIK